MVDYIRGKKAYTKWDADTENVDIEYHEGPKSSSLAGWLSGRKGKAIKILLVALVFVLGLVLGYLIQRSVHDDFFHAPRNGGPATFDYSPEDAILLQKNIQAHSISEFLRNLSLKPHLAGGTDSKEAATTIRKLWEQWSLDDVRLERYNVLLSYPSPNQSNVVTVFDQITNITVLNFTSLPHRPELRPFHAFAPRGTTVGKLVYANFGRREDFEQLKKLKVSVAGSVVIMRLGKTHRGDKVRWATENGAVGALLYPDPADFVGSRQIFPDGLGLPGNAIVYGNLKTYPGDPETPGLPSIDAAYRSPPGSNLNLPSIPVQPLSYNEAQQLLSNMAGPDSPTEWKGDLNISYRLGPGFDSSNEHQLVKIEVHNQLVRKDIFNVLGTMYGQYEKDEYVIVGCHHDTWTSGASDPGSGMAVMMELVRAFGQLRKSGWVPNRSIVFASWDAEEFGIIGSTEWVEDHAKELVDNAIAYINLDTAVTGNYTLHALGSPLLKTALYEATKQVPVHESSTEHANTFEMWRERNQQKDEDALITPKMDILGTGSDFVSFMSGYGIPSVHVQFIERNLDVDYPLYHTQYDLYDAVANYTDPSFNASATLARVVATLVLRLSDSLMLPFSCHEYVRAMEVGLTSLQKTYGEFLGQHGIHLDILRRAITHFDRAASIQYTSFNKQNGSNSFIVYHEYNHKMMQIERTFILPRGVEGSPVYRHAIFGPHPYNMREGITFPGIVDSILRAQRLDSSVESIETIKVQIAQVVQVIRAAGSMLITSVVTHYTTDSFL